MSRSEGGTLDGELLPVSITHGNMVEALVDALAASGANRVNDLYCLAFKVTEENRSKEAPSKNVNSPISTSYKLFLLFLLIFF